MSTPHDGDAAGEPDAGSHADAPHTGHEGRDTEPTAQETPEPETRAHDTPGPTSEAHGPADQPTLQHPAPGPGGPPSDPPTDPNVPVAHPQPGWAPPPGGVGGPYLPPAPRNGMGTAALVLGIVGVILSFSVVLGIVLGVLALILGLVARGRVKRGEATNRGATTAGIVLGVIALVIAIAAGILYATVVPAFVARHTANSGLTECVRQAHGDRTAIRQCRQQYGPGNRHRARPPG